MINGKSQCSESYRYIRYRRFINKLTLRAVDEINMNKAAL